MKKLVQRFLADSVGIEVKRIHKVEGLKPHLPHDVVRPSATYAPWKADEGFRRAFEKVSDRSFPYTLVDEYRLFELHSLCTGLARVPGSILEVGVWRGGSAGIMANALRLAGIQRRLYLADTFTGVAKAGEMDTRYKGNEHSDTSIENVYEVFRKLDLEEPVILEGIFPEDTGHLVDGPIALLHSDVDVYQSTKDIIEWALPRLSPGGLIVFDDYGFHGCDGVAEFVNEFRMCTDMTFIHNLNGHAIFVKA